ncbi:hypothetical protein C3L33_22566, partial [Rhododendron williamsianum]
MVEAWIEGRWCSSGGAAVAGYGGFGVVAMEEERRRVLFFENVGHRAEEKRREWYNGKIREFGWKENEEMPLLKYYCDYCEKQFQDTPAARKRHLQGVQHQRAKALYYQNSSSSSSFLPDANHQMHPES